MRAKSITILNSTEISQISGGVDYLDYAKGALISGCIKTLGSAIGDLLPIGDEKTWKGWILKHVNKGFSCAVSAFSICVSLALITEWRHPHQD